MTVAACGSSASTASAVKPIPAVSGSASASALPTRSTLSTRSAAPSPAPSPSPTVDPGTLPQLDTRPIIDANFNARLASYWTRVLAGEAGPADNFFFPRAAYLQVKELSNAAADFDGRLYHDYKNDVMADHQLVTSLGAGARILGVDIPEASVHWVPPGVEVNRIGYWQVSYPRLRYVVSGQEHSYAFSSMISWRGQWYVVHLGPNWRPGSGGWVCTPQPPTAPAISAACLRG
jgi:hypothetical protein